MTSRDTIHSATRDMPPHVASVVYKVESFELELLPLRGFPLMNATNWGVGREGTELMSVSFTMMKDEFKTTVCY